eukprot:351491-Chlamydomonas_euryale.AAC.11
MMLSMPACRCQLHAIRARAHVRDHRVSLEAHNLLGRKNVRMTASTCGIADVTGFQHINPNPTTLLGGNLGGITTALLGLDGGAFAARTHLDVLVPVLGHKRCLDYSNGFASNHSTVPVLECNRVPKLVFSPFACGRKVDMTYILPMQNLRTPTAGWRTKQLLFDKHRNRKQRGLWTHHRCAELEHKHVKWPSLLWRLAPPDQREVPALCTQLRSCSKERQKMLLCPPHLQGLPKCPPDYLSACTYAAVRRT